MASLIATKCILRNFSRDYARTVSLQRLNPDYFPSLSKSKPTIHEHRALTEKCIIFPKLGVSFSNSTPSENENNTVGLDSFNFQKVCDETLDSLCEYFEDLIEQNPNLISADVMYGDGVLTVNFSSSHGTYVINRQSPNRQIWLSSPTSGPKRYDFCPGTNTWIYKHTNESLHELLQVEIPKIVNQEVDFFQCAFSGKSGNSS